MAPLCKPESMSIQRLFARLFVAGGGVFWISAAFGADFGYRGMSPMVSARSALLPLALTMVILAVGWFSEYAASALLIVGSAMIVAWGVVAGWETGVWGLMGVTLLAPMLIAATLYFLAARMDTVCAFSPARS